MIALALRVQTRRHGQPKEGTLLAIEALGSQERWLFVSNAPRHTPLDELVRAASRRHLVEEAFENAKGDAAAIEVRRLREWARAWLSRWSKRPGDDYSAELRHLNRILAGTPVRWELIETPSGWEMVDGVQVSTAGDLVGMLALALARLVSAEDPHRLRRCAGAAGTLWFVDRTKAGRRLYCSASGCGNRAKVAAFRRRRRNLER